MRNINDEDIQELLIEGMQQRVSSEEQMQGLLKELEARTQAMRFEVVPTGAYYLYKWQTCFTEDTAITSHMDVPSLRIYLASHCPKGFMARDSQGNEGHISEGTCNVAFCKEGYGGRLAFAGGAPTQIETVALSEEGFRRIAERYPQVFMSHFLRYERGEPFAHNAAAYQHKGAAIQQLMHQMEQSPLMGAASQVYAELKLTEMLLVLFSEVETAAPQRFKSAAERERLEEVCRLITEDLLHTPSIAELARAVGTNEKKLCYSFKEAYGTTVYGYLFEHKMQLARRLLVETDMNVSEVAWQCGYTYVSHFSKAFKRRWGEVPSLMSKEVQRAHRIKPAVSKAYPY